MLHEAEHAPIEKKLLIQFAKSFRRSRKTQIPKMLGPGPVLGPGLAIFYTAFWDLVTERHEPDSPIPWSSIRLWAEKHRLGEDATERLEYLVREMDLAFLKWRRHNSRKRKGDDSEESERGKSRAVRTKHASPRQ